jgi:hypothetical protein
MEELVIRMSMSVACRPEVRNSSSSSGGDGGSSSRGWMSEKQCEVRMSYSVYNAACIMHSLAAATVPMTAAGLLHVCCCLFSTTAVRLLYCWHLCIQT